MPDLDALLEQAALPEKTVDVCLRGDLVARVEDLERELQERRSNVETLADRGDLRALADQIVQAREEMAAATVVFRLRGITRPVWTALVAAHPPRDGNKEDERLGYNEDAFFAALIRACTYEPELTDERWERLAPVLTSGQHERLIDAALATSRRQVSVPFLSAASASLSSSDDNSK